MEYFTSQNLPNKCSEGVIVDYRISEESINSLTSLGIQVFKSCKVNNLYSAVCGHPDMQIHHLGNNRFVCAPETYEHYMCILSDAELIKGSKMLTDHYPDDICYNTAVFGKYVICNAVSTAIEILSEYQRRGKTILNANQGYAKCSICIVNENAIITADEGVNKIAKSNGIDVLKINEGYITLKDMSYGFIGGATGLIAPDTLAVNGDIKTHKDCDNIISFCKNHRVDVLSLKKGEIEDIGSILAIF